MTILTVVMVLAVIGFSVGQGAADPVKFESAKPLFIKLAVTQDASRALNVAFDEPRGTGTGYTVMYADTNFNQKFEGAEKREVPQQAGSSLSYLRFPPLNLTVPYSNKGIGPETSTAISFLAIRMPGQSLQLAASMQVKLSDDAGLWSYNFNDQRLTYATSLDEAPLQKAAPLKPVATIRSGDRTGIAVKLQAGTFDLQCSSPSGSVLVTLIIKSASGETVHEDTMPLGQLGFG